MNNRESQLIKAAKWYFNSDAWYFMSWRDQWQEIKRISSVIKRSRSRR